jgi:RpiR family carbohydrate utilization transcriptional regulator
MENKDVFLLRLRGLLPSLNPKLKTIAEYILANPHLVKLQRISELAGACGVADSTVTRFVKAINLKTFQELKILIAGITSSMEAEREEFVYDDVTKGDSLESIIEKIAYINLKALQDTKKIIDMREVERAAAAIDAAGQIDIYGAGGSFVAAENARLRFYRIGKRCQIYNDPNPQAVSASLLTPRDAAIGISNSGRTLSTVNALRRAKDSGAETICITSYDKTPLTQFADITLFTSTQDSAFFQESMVSRIAQMFIIDVIYARLAVKSFATSVKLIEKSAEALRNAFL